MWTRLPCHSTYLWRSDLKMIIWAGDKRAGFEILWKHTWNMGIQRSFGIPYVVVHIDWWRNSSLGREPVLFSNFSSTSRSFAVNSLMYKELFWGAEIKMLKFLPSSFTSTWKGMAVLDLIQKNTGGYSGFPLFYRFFTVKTENKMSILASVYLDVKLRKNILDSLTRIGPWFPSVSFDQGKYLTSVMESFVPML